MRVVVNGFGRIGRTVLRVWLQGGWPEIDIVGINDIAAPDMCAYLFEFDSVFGVWTGSVALEEGFLVLNGRRIALTREADLSVLDLSGVDVVMECTGRADRAGVADRALTGGARRVLVSGPSAAAGVTVVLGANEAQLGTHRIVSNASCTTNALAPLARLLHETFGIVTGSMVTIHCYTGSQPTVDAPRGDPARSRAAGLSMVPTTTSAQRLVERVLPEMQGRLLGAAVRVRSELLDRLVNQIGEVRITRSRMESELVALRGSLKDLTGNLDRLRQQLRQQRTQLQSWQCLALQQLQKQPLFRQL
jgi:glyceraldehyde 3-phosphate dehydrogenase